MTRTLHFAASVGIAALLPCMAHAQALNVKPGGWETTTQTVINGTKKTFKDKVCITAEDLQKDRAFLKDADEGCKWNITTKTLTRFVASGTCGNSQGKATHSFDVSAPSPERVVIKHTGTVSMGGRTSNVSTEASSRWMGASCAGFDD